MGLTGVYNAPVSEDAGVAIIMRAFEDGVTFFETADAYGPHTNEVLLGKVRIFLLLPNSDDVFVSHSVGVVKLCNAQLEW
jgi:aryl-alcohol dehydrogenase-like predicted oxidoreductase